MFSVLDLLSSTVRNRQKIILIICTKSLRQTPFKKKAKQTLPQNDTQTRITNTLCEISNCTLATMGPRGVGREQKTQHLAAESNGSKVLSWGQTAT